MKEFFFSDIADFRCERKFYIEHLMREDIENIVKIHPGMFKERYPKRRVNSIYLDSLDLANYFDNINSAGRRLKIRIRWYGNLFGVIGYPVLEVKLRENYSVGKLFYPLKSFPLDNNFSRQTILNVIKESALGENIKLYLKQLYPCLLSTYTRKYFLSLNAKFRVTVDTNMQAVKLSAQGNNFLNKSMEDKGGIVELKYELIQDKFADNITKYFPFRISRSSKYIEGINRVYFHR